MNQIGPMDGWPNCPAPAHLVRGADLATALVQGVARHYARQPGDESYLGADRIEREMAAVVRQAADPENLPGFVAALRTLLWTIGPGGGAVEPSTWDGAGALAFEREFIEFESVDRTLQAITSGTLDVGSAAA